MQEGTIEDKLNQTVQKIYGGNKVVLTAAAQKQAKQLTDLGFGNAPICMAKTQYSLTDDPKKLGAPTDFDITVRNLKVSAGAGFIVALTGDIMTILIVNVVKSKNPAAFCEACRIFLLPCMCCDKILHKIYGILKNSRRICARIPS